MFITDVLELKITLDNINDKYVKNRESYYLKKIKNQYEGTCINNKYIYKINKILKLSLTNIIRRTITSDCDINVILSVVYIIINPFDVITNNKVVEIVNSKNIIICKNDYASILIENNKTLSNIKVNQNIPIIVGRASYRLHESFLTINAFPFIVMLTKPIIYKIDPLTNDEKEKLQVLIDDIKNIKSEKNKRWLYFEKLIYPFKTDKSKLTKNQSAVDIFDLDQSGLILISDEQKILDGKIIKLEDNKDYISENSLTVYTLLLVRYLKRLTLIKELSDIYADDKVFNDHENIFEIYESSKK